MTSDRYRQLVESRALTRDGQPILNSSVGHVAVVIGHLFANARKKVDVLSGSFNARVYGRAEVITEAKLFLVSSLQNKLRIILENDSPVDRRIHPFFKACSSLPNIELRVAPPSVQNLYGFHFVVADDDSYRLEIDKTQPAAIAAFGESEGAKNLEGIYSYLWDRCKVVEIFPRS